MDKNNGSESAKRFKEFKMFIIIFLVIMIISAFFSSDFNAKRCSICKSHDVFYTTSSGISYCKKHFGNMVTYQR